MDDADKAGMWVVYLVMICGLTLMGLLGYWIFK